MREKREVMGDDKWAGFEGNLPPVGWESDREEEEVFYGDCNDYQGPFPSVPLSLLRLMALGTIANNAASLFNDVYEEYDSLPPILDKFESWKWHSPIGITHHPPSSLSSPLAFSLFILVRVRRCIRFSVSPKDCRSLHASRGVFLVSLPFLSDSPSPSVPPHAVHSFLLTVDPCALESYLPVSL